VAVDRDQAGLVYSTTKRMIELNPILNNRLEIIDSRKRIIDRKTNSFYQVLPGDAAGALGTNPSMVLFLSLR
jgi:phage terminase large subunit-like protein